MTEDEWVALELELDEKHKPLTAYERSKGIVQRAQEWAAAAKLVSPINELQRPEENPYGIEKKEVAKAIGVSDGALRNAERHVAAVNEFPDLMDTPHPPMPRRPSLLGAAAAALDGRSGKCYPRVTPCAVSGKSL